MSHFLDESSLNIYMVSSKAHSIRGTLTVVETPTACNVTHTIMGAITADYAILNEIKEPFKPKKVKVDGSMKRKKPG
ncbi:uncharacterized protein EV154DRAFT_431459 [Mucor mucedo]|uniref:uncharacterized protein n=1 Tax=Mucor mucedo TaxID=29922 RepID=UPI00222042CB|nr:uncharacterized protein EV154DRAFT_431459 [Mucor mucedo]KAI7871971.1 hypothetical protein EV154DRAFT_431459 [Mucor mucedo]